MPQREALLALKRHEHFKLGHAGVATHHVSFQSAPVMLLVRRIVAISRLPARLHIVWLPLCHGNLLLDRPELRNRHFVHGVRRNDWPRLQHSWHQSAYAIQRVLFPNAPAGAKKSLAPTTRGGQRAASIGNLSQWLEALGFGAVHASRGQCASLPCVRPHILQQTLQRLYLAVFDKMHRADLRERRRSKPKAPIVSDGPDSHGLLRRRAHAAASLDLWLPFSLHPSAYTLPQKHRPPS
mmetsp:Transcript_13549/g.22343  ORF Transcript_13549/g.22343 Transcript_13549/m.22343 type:complete len:238 (+) Transcript_13549:133-846(+)